jgi:hypothetical protein
VSMFLVEQPFPRPSVRSVHHRRSGPARGVVRAVRFAVDGVDLVLPVLPGARRRLLAKIARRARARIRPFCATAASASPQRDKMIGSIVEASVRHIGELVVLMRIGIWLAAFATLGTKALEDSSTAQLVFLYVFFAAWLIVVQIWGRRYPERFVLYFLLAALAELAYNPHGWRYGRFRRRVLRRLNLAAGWTAEGMPRHARKQDMINHAWAKQSYGQVAAAMRTWGQLAIVPGPTSRQQLIDKLSSAVAQIATGEWEGMERLDPADRPGATARTQQAERARRRVRRTLVAAAVLALMGLLLGSYSAVGASLIPHRTVLAVAIATLLPLTFSSTPASEQLAAKVGELFTKTSK